MNHNTTPSTRRYDIDWIRVIAIFLLIFFHALLAFIPSVAQSIQIIGSDEPLHELWPLAALLNIWRIPILFVISGMGVAFAMRRRTLRELLIDRSKRLLIPYILGICTIGPLISFIVNKYLHISFVYLPTHRHLWFLLNIWLYAMLYSTLFYRLKNQPNRNFLAGVRVLLASPWALYLFAIPYILEELLVVDIYTIYHTMHGFVLGAIAFGMGFLFIEAGDVFWQTVKTRRWLFLGIAFSLYLVRLIVFRLKSPMLFLSSTESISWIYAILGFGYTYLNYSNKWLVYLSKAIYPVYILHYLFQAIGSYFIMRLEIPVLLQLLLLCVFIMAGSFATYEWVLKRSGKFQWLFGMFK